MSRAALLLALPAVTGLASVIWAQITATSRLLMAGLNVLAYLVVLVVVLVVDGPALPNTPSILPLIGYVLLSVVVALVWFAAADAAPIGALALAESAYPLVVLAISRAFAGAAPLSWTTCIGAVLVMVGVPLIAIGGDP